MRSTNEAAGSGNNFVLCGDIEAPISTVSKSIVTETLLTYKLVLYLVELEDMIVYGTVAYDSSCCNKLPALC